MRAVVLLTAAMMAVEIAVGYATGSMALLADGWHMATHVCALGIASAAYVVARRFSTHRAFAFGTGKIPALAGYTSAGVLGFIALAMLAESAARLVRPAAIDFASSLPVACIGLCVNLLSIRLLREHEDEDSARRHDHNHRAAVVHVVADALTSALAILALLAGRLRGWVWLDPLTGIVGSFVVLKWGFDLCRATAHELLDLDSTSGLEDRIRTSLEELEDVRVMDLHVWSLGQGRRGCIVSLVAQAPRETREYRERILAVDALSHLTVEVERCRG